jgi:hypothetical protein
MLVFGGVDGGGPNAVFFNDTWLLSLDPTPSWQQLDVGILLPAARAEASAAFDRTSFQLVINGGSGPRWDLATWVLQLDEEVEVLASLVSANAEPGRVEISWQLSSSGASATVSRSASGGPWVDVATLDADGMGRMTCVDRDVTAGTRYGYRLGLSGPGGGVFAGEVWVDLPGSPRLALLGIRPNPARGRRVDRVLAAGCVSGAARHRGRELAAGVHARRRRARIRRARGPSGRQAFAAAGALRRATDPGGPSADDQGSGDRVGGGPSIERSRREPRAPASASVPAAPSGRTSWRSSVPQLAWARRTRSSRVGACRHVRPNTGACSSTVSLEPHPRTTEDDVEIVPVEEFLARLWGPAIRGSGRSRDPGTLGERRLSADVGSSWCAA